MSDNTGESNPPDMNQRVKDAEAETQALTAEKKAVDARLELEESKKKLSFTSKVGDIPNSGIKGDVELADKAGTLEMNLLAAVAIDEAAGRIARKISAVLKSRGGSNELHVTLIGQSPDLQAAYAFRAQRDQVASRLRQAIGNADKASKPSGEESVLAVATTSLAAIASYFKSDFKVGGSDIAFDESILIQSLLGKDLGTRSVTAPSLFTAPELNGVEKLLQAELEACCTLRDLASNKSNELTLKLAGAANPLPAVGSANDELKAAIALHDALAIRICATDDTAAALRRDLIWNAQLKNTNAYVLVLKLQRSGGSFYVEKNFWTAFGRLPFSVAGGAIVSFTLFKGDSGAVMASDVLPVHAGFKKVNDLQALCGLRVDESPVLNPAVSKTDISTQAGERGVE